jgi:hypothetical protein
MHIGFWWETRRKEPLRRPRCRLEDNIKMDLRETGWGYGLDSFGLGYGTLEHSC